METDERLLLRWRDGDRLAGSELLRRYFQPLYRFFRGKVDHGVDELIQATLTACVEGRDRIRDAPNFRAFMFGVARNQLYARLRLEAKVQGPIDTRSVADLGSSPSAIVARKVEYKLLGRALRRLPLDVQILLELFYWEELTGPELAAALELPEGTVRTRLRRARQLLQQEVEALAATSSPLQTTEANLERWVRAIRDHLEGAGPDAGET